MTASRPLLPATTSTVVRIKRARDEEPLPALIVSKVRKLGEGERENSVYSHYHTIEERNDSSLLQLYQKPSPALVPPIIKSRTKLPTQDELRLSRADAMARQSKNARLRLVSQHRLKTMEGKSLQVLDFVQDDDEDELPEEIRKMIQEYSEESKAKGKDLNIGGVEKHVFDVYEYDPHSTETMDDDNLAVVSVDDVEFVNDENHDDDEMMDEADEDSNAEDDYRNDYPDEEGSDDGDGYGGYDDY
ncbi:hypothetical protein HDU76_012971 [Blyttiomyces sp. JEL0837]|nr:hypothetical protein HDU76_012971 [Blyttiomyces sp. JEL0837]